MLLKIGTVWRSWLRQCATIRKDEGKGGWCVGLTPLPTSSTDCLEILVRGADNLTNFEYRLSRNFGVLNFLDA